MHLRFYAQWGTHRILCSGSQGGKDAWVYSKWIVRMFLSEVECTRHTANRSDSFKLTSVEQRGQCMHWCWLTMLTDWWSVCVSQHVCMHYQPQYNRQSCIFPSHLLLTVDTCSSDIPYGWKFWREDILADCWNYDIWLNLLWRLRKS